MDKKKWIVVCPSCDQEEEIELEYTEKELVGKGLLINDSKIISHCKLCLTSGKKEILKKFKFL